jgi:hypothetical protein
MTGHPWVRMPTGFPPTDAEVIEHARRVLIEAPETHAARATLWAVRRLQGRGIDPYLVRDAAPIPEADFAELAGPQRLRPADGSVQLELPRAA